MADVRERIKELVDRLDPEVALDLEWLVARLALGPERTGWLDLSAAAFADRFDETEVEYTEADLPKGA